MPSQENQPEDRSPRRSVFSVLRDLLKGNGNSKQREIVRETNGFSLYVNDQINWSLSWEDVTAVVAYKHDLGSVDQICFGFRIKDDQLNLRCIDEDTPGFKSIQDDLSRKTEDAWPALFQDVAWPPFEFCWTVIWAQPGSPPLDENPNLHMIDPDIGSNF